MAENKLKSGAVARALILALATPSPQPLILNIESPILRSADTAGGTRGIEAECARAIK